MIGVQRVVSHPSVIPGGKGYYDASLAEGSIIQDSSTRYGDLSSMKLARNDNKKESSIIFDGYVGDAS